MTYLKDKLIVVYDAKEQNEYLHAEYSLLDFTERVCKIHGQHRGIYLIYYRIFQWLADKLLWRS